MKLPFRITPSFYLDNCNNPACYVLSTINPTLLLDSRSLLLFFRYLLLLPFNFLVLFGFRQLRIPQDSIDSHFRYPPADNYVSYLVLRLIISASL
jgi:hypothetical protein